MRQLSTSNQALTKEVALGSDIQVWATQEMDGAVTKPTAFSTPIVQGCSCTGILVHCHREELCCAALQGCGCHVSQNITSPTSSSHLLY